jgi:hypothetical protein
MSMEVPHADLFSSSRTLKIWSPVILQGIPRLGIIGIMIPLFLVSVASGAAPASFQGISWDQGLVASPSSVNFGSVQIGSSRAQYETLTNSGD